MGGINYVSPTGRVVTVEDKDRSLYESLGYRPETIEHEAAREGETAREDYYSGTLQRIQAGVEGAASGLTLGVSDMIAGPDSETARRARYNPGTRLAGEIVGGLIGLKGPVGGGLSKATHAGKEAGAIAKAVGAGAEGAVYGATQNIAQARLNGDPLTVETVVHGVGLGAMIGVGASGAGSLLERHGARAEMRAAEVAKREERIAHLETQLERMDSAPGVMGVDHAAHWGEFKSVARETADDLLGQVRLAEDAVKEVKGRGSFMKSADEALIEAPPVSSRTADALMEAKANANAAPSQKNWLARRGNMVEQVAGEMQEATAKAAFDWRRPALKEAAQIADQAMDAAFKTGDTALARKAAANFFATAERAGVTISSGMGHLGVGGVEEALKAVEEMHVMRDVGKTLREIPQNMTKMGQRQADKVAAAIERASTLSQNGRALREATDSLMERVGVLHDGTLAERLYQSVDTARNAPNAAKAQKAASKAKRASIEKELKELKTPEEEPKGKKKTFLRRIMGFMAAGYGAKAGGQAIGGGYVGRAIGAMTGAAAMNAVTGTSEGSLLGAVLGAKSRLSSRVSAVSARYARSAGAGLRRGAPAYAAILRHTALSDRDGENVRELAKARIDELNELLPGLPEHAYAASVWLADDHPEAAKGAEEWITNAITYLQSTAPKNPGTVVVAGKDRWTPSDLRSREFADRCYGCFFPVEAGEAFLRGEATPATVQSMAACNPGVYALYRDRLALEMSDPLVMKRMDAHARSKASYFTGVPYDSFQQPDVAEFFQQQFANAQTMSQVPPAAGNPAGRPPGPADQGAAMQTQAQRLTYR